MHSDLVHQYLETLSSDQTRRAYRTDLRSYFGDRTVGETTVKEVDGDAIQRFLRVLKEHGQAESTQRRRLSALRAFLDWLVEKGVLSHNPARKPNVQIEKSKPTADRPRILTEDDVRLLVSTAKENSRSGVRDYALLLTIFYGALRRSEVVELDVEDVRPLGRHWIIDLDPLEGYIKIPDLVVDAIESMKTAYDIKEGPLWRSLSNRNSGARMSPDAVYKVVRRTAQEAEIGVVNIEMLRRTGLHLALQGGARLPQIQAHGRLKHSASAASYFEDQPRNSLRESAVDFIGIDLQAFGSGE